MTGRSGRDCEETPRDVTETFHWDASVFEFTREDLCLVCSVNVYVLQSGRLLESLIIHTLAGS